MASQQCAAQCGGGPWPFGGAGGMPGGIPGGIIPGGGGKGGMPGICGMPGIGG